MIDLHIHSTASDGSLSPKAVVQLAKEGGFSTIAIADHDTVSGISQAILAGEGLGVRVLPAVELSIGVSHEIHLLGYGIRHEDAGIQALLAQLRKNREVRIAAMVQRLQEGGYPIDLAQVQAGVTDTIGRPHIAAVLVQKGIAKDTRDAFTRFIGKNAPYYVEMEKITTKQAIEAIRAAGGIAALAHPGQLKLDQTQLHGWISHLKNNGLQALECYHSAHTREDELFLRNACKSMDLLVTGGSDFHGAAKPHIQLGSGLARWPDQEACLSRLETAILHA